MLARTGDQFRKLLSSLLPKGKIWNRISSSVLQKLLYGLSDELSEIDSRILNLYEEKDVRTAVELLTEHETDFGLPDEGDEISTITSERQDELHTALLKVGQQFKDYYVELVEPIGYDITITEFTPCWAGLAQAGDPCGDQNNIFFWKVNILLSSVDETAEVNLTKLINKIEGSKPAHTHVLYDFYGAEFGRGFSTAFDRIPHYDNSWSELDFGRGFSNAFANAYDYDGINYTGAFNHSFSIAFDRHSGGDFDHSGFSTDFFKPN